MRIFDSVERLVEWFTPAEIAADIHARKRVRMFLISHFFGPVLSHPITIFLLLNDPAPWPHVALLAASITAFWLFPIALKLFPRHYPILALLSVANLNFAILWGAIVGGTFGLSGYEANFKYNLENVLEAFWRSMFSFFSTQYVEQYPHSVGGKVVALFLIVSGSFFFALVTGMTSALLGEKLREGGRVLDDFFIKQLNGHMLMCGWNSGALSALRELQLNAGFLDKEILIMGDRESVEGLDTLPLPNQVRFVRDDRIEMERNDFYNGPSKSPWANVTIRFIANPSTRLAALLSGDVQAIENVPTPDIERVRKDPNLNLVTKTSERMLFLCAQ